MEKKKRKIIGKNYLRCHPPMEEELNVPKGYVIVTQKDFSCVVEEYKQMAERVLTLRGEVSAISHFIDMVERLREAEWEHYKASDIAEPEQKDHLRQVALSRGARVDDYIKNLRRDQYDERKINTLGHSSVS